MRTRTYQQLRSSPTPDKLRRAAKLRKSPAKAPPKKVGKKKAPAESTQAEVEFNRAPPDLTDNVANWMNGQGYPLEMRVAREVRRQGGVARNSVYYTDPIENKDREIDVSADFFYSHDEDEARTDDDEEFWLSVFLAIECKYSKDKPWVGLVDPPDSGYLSRARQNYRMSQDLGDLLRRSRRPLVALYPFQRPQAAYGICQAFRNDEGNKPKQQGIDPAYAAIEQVTTAAGALPIVEDPKIYDEYTMVIPLVVVDGYLFECYLDPVSESISINSTPHITVDLRKSGSPVHVVTVDYLPDFLSQIIEFKGNMTEAVIQRRQVIRATEEAAERKTTPDTDEAGTL